MLRAIAVTIVMMVGLTAALFSRFDGLLLYIWFALFRPQEWVWFDISFLHLSLVTGLLVVVPSFFGGIFPNLTHPLSIGSILFLVSALVAQFSAVNQEMGWLWLDFVFRLTLLCLLLITLVDTRRRLILVIAVIAASLGFPAATRGLSSLLSGGVELLQGTGGAFEDRNDFALGIAMILPLIIATSQNFESTPAIARWVRRACWIVLPLATFCVISTFSRGGLLALGGATISFVALQRRRLTVVAAFLLVLLTVGPLIPLPEGYTDRIHTIGNFDETDDGVAVDTSAASRLHIWRMALSMSAEHLSGVGLMNFPYMYDRYDTSGGQYGRRRALHNSHLQALCEVGVQGFMVYLWMFLYAFAVLLRIRREAIAGRFPAASQKFYITMANALCASMVAFLVGGTFLSMAFNDLTWLTFAIVASLDRLSRKERTMPIAHAAFAPTHWGQEAVAAR